MRENSLLGLSKNRWCALRDMTIALAVAGLLGGCSSWCRVPPRGGSISGRVVDPQDQAVPGVEVRVSDRLVGVTDSNGTFVIRAVPNNDRLPVSFSAPKFMSTTRIYETRPVPPGNTIVIWPRATPARLQASKAGHSRSTVERSYFRRKRSWT